MTDLITRLRAYTDHRGDGIPTQPVNPDGEEAAARIEALEKALTLAANRLDRASIDYIAEGRAFGDEIEDRRFAGF